MTTQRQDGRDEWVTPNPIYHEICNYWNLKPQIDVFASAENTKCKLYIDRFQDALKTDWVRQAEILSVDPVFWLQPPYSQPIMTLAIEKAIEEANNGGVSLFLLPAWVDQKWYHELILDKFKHRPYPGRIKFEPPVGIIPSSPRYGNIHGVIALPSFYDKYQIQPMDFDEDEEKPDNGCGDCGHCLVCVRMIQEEFK